MSEHLANQERLLIFTRYPLPGKTKTRMIPVLGAAGAAKLQRQMTEKTLTVAKELQIVRPVSIAMYFTGSDLSLMQQWLGVELDYYQQSPGDLGEKLKSAIKETYNQGISRIVVIGIDCPDLTPTILNEAFECLNQGDLVIGPAEDGGYYLIGLSCCIPELFEDIAWGTEIVFSQTDTIAQKLNLVVNYLPTLKDVDRPEDL